LLLFKCETKSLNPSDLFKARQYFEDRLAFALLKKQKMFCIKKLPFLLPKTLGKIFSQGFLSPLMSGSFNYSSMYSHIHLFKADF
jgi:hypothetical protein